MKIKLSELDTSHFGKRIARLEVDGDDDLFCVNEWCHNNKIDVLIARGNSNVINNKVMQKILCDDFVLVDTLVWYKKDIIDLPNIDIHIRIANRLDLPYVERIARAAFCNYDSHYKAIDSTKSTEAYVKWAVSDKPNTKTLVYDDGNKIIGFVIIDFINSSHLYAVDPDAQGNGIGKKMILAAIDCFKRECLDQNTFLISTQIQNVKSIGVWRSLGFIESYTEYTFHKWYGGKR